MTLISRPNRSLVFKLLAVASGLIFIVLAISNYVVVSHASKQLKAQALEKASLQGRAIASEVSSEIGAVATAARSIASVMSNGHDEDVLTTKNIMATLKTAVDTHPLTTATWFCEVAGTFQSTDQTVGWNQKRVFAPIWSKSANGAKLDAFDSDYNAEWWTISSTSRKGGITSPFVGDVVKELMTTVTYPVFAKGQFVGVAGVGMTLQSLSDQLKAQRPFGSGHVYLLSNKGTWIVSPEPGLTTKPYGNAIGSKQVSEALENLQPAILEDVIDDRGDRFYRVVYPFALPDLNTNWAVLVDVPTAAISGPIQEQAMTIILGGLAVLILVCAGLYAASRYLIQQPLATLVKNVEQLSRGEYDTSLAWRGSRDEIGSVASAVESFRTRLQASREFENEAGRERSAAEIERCRVEQERAARSEDLRRTVTILADGLSKLSAGRLDHRISDTLGSEYEVLKTDFNNALKSLHEVIASLSSSVSSIETGSREIAVAASELSKRTEHQAAGIEETAAALTELSEQIHTSADNARSAASSVNLARIDAERSGEVVKSAVASMNHISQSSQEISRIISVIDEIAFQTNLLALNAGVEAARAGDAGKGFAVVAQEVRELAQRSANAAKEIKLLINQSSHQVEDGVEHVRLAGDALEKIARQVVSIDELVQQISSSAGEQAVALREITGAINQMDGFTQQNAAMVEQTTAASVGLSTEAEHLKGLVSGFRLSTATSEWQPATLKLVG